MEKPGIQSQITFLNTPNLTKTAHFYEDILSFDLILDQGTCRIYRLSKDGCLGFCERKAKSINCDRIIIALVTPFVDEWYKFLIRQGVEIDKPPRENSTFKIYHMFFRDPNGYTIEIQRFLNDHWDADFIAN
jgi:catechol 2,3-dioxygenase-like lactoylglutathione lyase family enzyme